MAVTFSCACIPTYSYCPLLPPIDTVRSDWPVHEDTATKKAGTRQPNGLAELKATLMFDGAMTDTVVVFGDISEYMKLPLTNCEMQ